MTHIRKKAFFDCFWIHQKSSVTCDWICPRPSCDAWQTNQSKWYSTCFNPFPMFIESPISGPSPLAMKVSEELPNSDLSQLEHKPQVPVPSEIFENQDILGVILKHCQHDQSLEATWKNWHLAALASKAFLEPAMNSLWSSLDSLMPLLKLLLSFVLINNVYMSWRFLIYWSSVIIMFQVFTGIIAEGHWERFDYYAHASNFSLHWHLGLTKIGSRCPTMFTCILCRFGCRIHPLHFYPHCDAFAFPTFLTPLALVYSLLTLVYLLHFLCPLEISFPGLSFSPDLFDMLISLEYLSDFMIDFAPPLTLGPPLHKNKRGGMGFRLARATDRMPLLKLDQLNNLQITGSSTTLSHVLGQLHALRLKSMVVKIRAETTVMSLDLECFKGIARSPSMSSICIAGTGSCSVFLTISNIHLILTLSQLEELDISVYSMAGGNEVIQELSSNLPTLKTLILPLKWNQFEPFQAQNPTFCSLDILAYNCPNLIQLKLAINLLADLPSFHNNISAVWQCSHPLKALYIADANSNEQPLMTTQRIAISCYIDQIFSNLEFVGHHGSGNKFREVEELRSTFQAIRCNICESLVETPQPCFVSKATQTTYIPGGTNFTWGKLLKTLPLHVIIQGELACPQILGNSY